MVARSAATLRQHGQHVEKRLKRPHSTPPCLLPAIPLRDREQAKEGRAFFRDRRGEFVITAMEFQERNVWAQTRARRPPFNGAQFRGATTAETDNVRARMPIRRGAVGFGPGFLARDDDGGVTVWIAKEASAHPPEGQQAVLGTKGGNQ